MGNLITLRLEGPAPRAEAAFRHLWCKLVAGFDAGAHCARCLLGRYVPEVRPEMALPSTVRIDPGDAPFVYLCGVADRYQHNLHVALRPDPRGRLLIWAHGGITITIEGADGCRIPALPDGYRGLPQAFTRCRNWRFGVEHLEGRARGR